MNSNETDYDVIIIGGGPAGATAGYLLSGFGYSVLIIDKRKFPREKLCGGITTFKNIRLLERIFDATEASLLEQGIINFRSCGYEFRHRERVLFQHSSDIPLYFVDRNIYDDFLLNKAAQSGARVVQGDKVVSCDIDNTEVETASGKRYKSKFIIAADGVNSIARRSFPERLINRRRWTRNLGFAHEIFVKRDDIKDKAVRDIDIPIVILGKVEWGYAWIFPRSDRLSIGIGGLNQKNRGKMSALFQSFLNDLGIDHTKYKIKGAFVPLGSYVKRPVYKNVILTGDAGGYVDPALGEGIFFAQRTAELASWAIHRSIIEGRPMGRVYEALIWKYVLPEFNNAKIMRLPGFYISERLEHYPLQIWMKLLGKQHMEMLHGIRTNNFFLKINVHEDVSLGVFERFFTRPR